MAHSVTLTWTASTDLATPPAAGTGYNVYRSTTVGGEKSPALNPALIVANTFVDSSVAAGQIYDYVVTAVGAGGIESVHSNEASNVQVPILPPTGLSAVAA
jgi:fibronectin type 3 domain-containing protein